jgi:thiazole biosynthesis/tRNA modification protein ThiI
MEKIILIRYGEIFLKGNNRNSFESLLIRNVKHALKEFKFQFNRSQGRYIVEHYDEEFEGDIIEALKKVFGIHSVSRAIKLPTDLKAISEAAISVSPDEGTFRVTVRRADKRIAMTSTALAAEIGGDILDVKPTLKVDLFDYDTEISIDMRENGFTYVFTEKLLCAGGLPVGCSGKGLLLLSGGIDSPVAGYMMAKRGLYIEAIHFHSMPYTSEMAKEKVVKLAKIVSGYAGHIRIHVIPFTHIQEEIHNKCPAELMITIMRRIMMRIAERIAKDNDCGSLITGESLGQVASQTMQSITVTNNVVEVLPVFRPLIGMDKSEIMEIAEKIGTYETSILPYQDCCTVFLPKNPSIRPKLEVAAKSERALELETLIAEAMKNEELIDL